MSDSIIGKENRSYRKQRIAETSQNLTAPNRVQFAHKFTGGETTFNLLNMTLPSAEMPGFTNPAPTLLAGAGLATNPAGLKLYISLNGGRLLPYSEYRVLGTTIVFLGVIGSAGMPAGAYVFGEVDLIAANPLVVGDGRFMRQTYTLPVGQTTLNLGFVYKVGVNLLLGQVGDIKVYRNEKLQYRNIGNATASPSADGNFQEVDSGNGYGSTIVFNTAPTGQADTIFVEMGYQLASGQMQIWSELERLQGSILALSNDAAVAFGNPVSNYIGASAAEIDRRAFGDSVTALLNAQVPITTPLAQYTPALIGFGTPSNVKFWWRRNQEFLEVHGSFTSGTSTATPAIIPFPNNLVADGSKYSASISILGEFQGVAGVAVWNQSAGAVGWVFANSANATNVNLAVAAASTSALAPVNASSIISSGQSISLKFRVPIAGWEATQTLRQQLGL